MRVAPGCPDQPELSAGDGERDALLVDDFEDGAAELPAIAGRDGSWILGWDMAATVPDPKVEFSERCAARGRGAGHFSGFSSSDWGANWTAVLRKDVNSRALGFDASAYRGISFWAALGGEAARSAEVPVGVTTMDVAWNGGVCSTCMDYYRTTIALTHSWRRFSIQFDALAQAGTGDPLVPLRREALVGFIIWPTQDFDIWIDDVRFEP